MYLNAHTYYSLRYGTLSPQDLVKAAVAKGIRTLVLTDINNTSCSYTFIQECKAYGIKPVLGIEFRQDNRLLYIGIAKNKAGFFNLNHLLTSHSLNKTPLPPVAPPIEQVYLIYPQAPKPLRELYDYEYIGLRPQDVNALYSSPLKHHLHKLVAWNPITFLDHEGYRTHKLLRAIDLNTLVTKLKQEDMADEEEYLRPLSELRQAYQNYPLVIETTERLLEECTISMESNLSNNRQCFTTSKKGDYALLKKLTLTGLKQRYGEGHAQAEARVEKELKTIYQLDYCCYFLITWDITRYAKSVGYHYVGRGSGANSIVAYCLFITDVEPLELDLYFERFINQFRTSPPDFDIDFSWDERDDVIDYIFKRYGMEHTALLATYSTFKGKAIIREIGKAFGLPKAEIDLLIDEPLATDRHHGWGKHVFNFGERIANFPNYLSIHAGGILIAERPLNYFTALQLMPKGFPVVHFDMYGAEDLKFHKYDVLSQRGLGHIKDAVRLVHRNRGQTIDIHDVEKIKNDVKVKGALRSGHCIGCFYIESPAMRGLLHKLRCDTYVHLVAASSIIRPGVAKSGMMRQYIQRFHRPEMVSYLHPVFKKHLQETFGVMVYQEDVMKIVHHFAGLALDESDVLRRIMTGKRKNSDAFYKLRLKYFANCKERGYSHELAVELWRQIASFSGYSFCKAHSASFAVESFQSLYLKTYFPLEFMVAVINNFGGFYKTEYYFHEARMHGGIIHPPCVNKSEYLTTLYSADIFIGFVHVRQLGQKLAKAIVQEREQGGAFEHLKDFIRRVDISGEQLDLLIRVGAFRFTAMSKQELFWHKNAVFNPKLKRSQSGYLFGDPVEAFTLPPLDSDPFDQAFDEIELLGFPLRSPFDLIAQSPTGDIVSRSFSRYEGKMVRIVGYYVCRKDVRTANGKAMNFGTWLDREGHYFDTTHFPISLRRSPFRGKACYLIKGKVVSDFGFKSIEVKSMEKLAAKLPR